MKNLNIRRAQPQDEFETIDIRYKSWLKAYSHIFAEEEIHKHFKSMLENPEYRKNNLENIKTNPYFYVYCLDNKAIAVLLLIVDTINKENNEIVCFYCSPDYQRNGIGKELFDFAKDVFRKNNITSFKVEALKDNYIGCNFYTKHGGKTIKTIKKHMCNKDVEMQIFNFNI